MASSQRHGASAQSADLLSGTNRHGKGARRAACGSCTTANYGHEVLNPRQTESGNARCIRSCPCTWAPGVTGDAGSGCRDHGRRGRAVPNPRHAPRPAASSPGAPRMPPTPWMPKTSHTSSAFSRRLRPDTPHRHSGPAITPMAMEPIGPTRPAAGVMVKLIIKSPS